MRETLLSLDALSDEALVARLKKCLTSERTATALLLTCLAEVDQRRLYLSLGYSSLFTYCTQDLHLSERAAYSRIEAGRLVRRFPLALEMIADGRVSLTALALLGKHLTAANHRALLTEATHKSIREVEVIVARFNPRAVGPPSLRRLRGVTPVVVAPLPVPMAPLFRESPIAPDSASIATEVRGATQRMDAGEGTGATGGLTSTQDLPEHFLATARASTEMAAAERSTGAPASVAGEPRHAGPVRRRPPGLPLDERYSLHVTLSKGAHTNLMRARDLLRHAIPSGDLALVLERALSGLIADLEKKKLAMVKAPREHSNRPARLDSRHIPAALVRRVWRRDRGRCAFVGTSGRCRERGFLEVHHVVPFAVGGMATLANLELRCRAHNQYEANVYFGGQRSAKPG